MLHFKSVAAGCVALLGALLIGVVVSAANGAEKTLATFSIEDHLKREWKNELVFYPVAADVWGRKDVALRGPDGAVAMQWVSAEQAASGKPSVAFLANVPEFGKTTYELVVGAAANAAELKIVETDAALEIANEQIGLRLHRGAKATSDGPLAGFRLPSGKWIGGGKLTGDAKPTAHEAQVTARGPVFVDATVKYQFGEAGSWRLKFRVIRGEPVVLVDETHDLAKPANWRLFVASGWRPNQMLFRTSKPGAGSQFGNQETWPLGPTADGEPVFYLEPWLHWNYRSRQGNWFSLYNDAASDMLLIGAIRAASWLDIERLRASQAQSPAVVKFDGQGEQLAGDFPLHWGRRQWMLGATDRDESLSHGARPEQKTLVNTAPPPQWLLIKHGDFPLDLVKDYQLEWSGNHGSHPRLILTAADVARMRKTADVEGLKKKIATKRLATSPVYDHTMSESIEAYLVTGEAELGKHLCNIAAMQVQEIVDGYTKQIRLPTPGFAPHMRQRTATCLLLTDAVLDSDQMTPELRRRLRAQAAFIGYTLNSENTYSVARGYHGLPNMTTSHYGYKATAACFIPSHPEAKAWIADALREAHEELEAWSDDNGGWLEAPHYAMVSFDALLGVSVMAHNAGLGGDLYHPKMKKVMEWFAKISTPPDSRFGGFRHLPPIGNSYMIEPTGEFGVIARLWREKDPKFARQMQWMHRQQRSWSGPGIGGSYPALTGYRDMLLDPSLPEEVPAYSSELFPRTGVMLRSGFPTDRETTLHMIVGDHRMHYDYDAGSITLWGKGRILCEDFGYYGRAPAEDHSLVTAKSASRDSIDIDAFVSAASADYVCAVKDAWRRQIIFLKDADPLGPNYAVLCDTLTETDPDAMWRLWTTSKQVDARERTVLVTGKEDVDLDIHFALPAKPTFRNEPLTRTSGGLDEKGAWAMRPSTQNGVLVSMANQQVVTAALLPRLRDAKPYTVTTLAEGRTLRVQTEKGDDWIFLSATPFQFQQDGIDFRGTVGVVQLRGDNATLTLPAPGSLKAKGQALAR